MSVSITAAHTIATYSGVLTGNAANFVVGNASEYRQTFSIDTTSTPGSVLLNVTGASHLGLVWDNASANGRWDVNSSVNFEGEKFYTLDRVTFGTAAAGTGRRQRATVTRHRWMISMGNPPRAPRRRKAGVIESSR